MPVKLVKLWFAGKNKGYNDKSLKKQTGKLTGSNRVCVGFVTGVSWVLMSFFGGLPFFFSGEILSLVDSFFETASGFTTTGATVLTDIEAMSRGLLFWRSFAHWLGGMGVLMFLLAVMSLNKGNICT